MGKSKFLKNDIITSQDLASAALSYTTNIGQDFQVEEIHFHFSVAVTETITITLDSKSGANYDTVLRTINLNSTANAVYKPDPKSNYKSGDNIKVQCTNANGTGICYVRIVLSECS